MRYTEYHAGVAVIKKNKVKDAAAKLAKIEDMTEIPRICCEEYCKYPARCWQWELDEICAGCKLAPMFEMLI